MTEQKNNTECNKALIKAIQSLDSLNDEIVQFIFTPKSAEFDVDSNSYDDPPTIARCRQQREGLKTSMALVRRLLVDAQAKFRKMMEDNKALASSIDGNIQNTSRQEVSELRVELINTGKRISEITSTSPEFSDAPIMAGNTLTTCFPAPKNNVISMNQSESNCNFQNSKTSSSPKSSTNNSCSNREEGDSDKQTSPVKNNATSLISTTTPSNDNQCERCKNCTHEDINQLEERLCQQEDLNSKLSQQNRSLQKELEELRSYKDQEHVLLSRTQWLENELKHTKEALATLKQDRKRLRAEKFDLLNQMKELYGTLEDKENELRDFIRNYEQRMKDSDESLKQLVRTREEFEREKWSILKHARDEAEHSVELCAQLALKDAQIRQFQEEIRDRVGYFSDVESARNFRTNGYHSPSMTPTAHSSNAPTLTPVSERKSLSYGGTPTITVDEDQNSVYYSTTSTRDDRLLPFPGLSRSAEEIYVHSSANSDVSSGKKSWKRKERKGTWSSISRVFSRGRHRKGVDQCVLDGGSSDQRSSWSPQGSLCASPLSEDNYNEKLKLLEEAQGKPMETWKAATVLSWIEITLGMPQYGGKCAENIKSGKILLELSDGELETGLGISNPMHRRKLRLAIEEHRDSALCLNPKINLLSHMWVVDEWLPSLGLTAYSEAFNHQLVDGRMLDTLTKKDLEKHLNITRKFHQLSIMHAIHLLRIVKFDKQILTQRRSRCEHMDLDPLVWTNERFIKWVKSIDLEEYAENLQGSGVHGALVVLEPSFTADTMATALGIPGSKNIIRRHLTTELDNLIQPARMSLEAEVVFYSRKNQKKNTGSSSSIGTSSLGQSFMRSYSRGTLDKPDKRRTNTRFSTWKSSQLSVS
ncbi:kazrin-like isoform X2 [Limulus polyphemus]|uniref:Kazrin-like isoform X2 n=1 Tax=Limulus polyphemus TaxID=6850 RepID=A0ABM1SLD0_LIMPO|nr:kazrin-like isoform X2 [Limulus polyphemus]